MRKITIHQEDAKNIEVFDENDDPLDEYCNRLSTLMKMGNVAILQTSSASVVLRPSKVVGIKVENGTSKIEEIPPTTLPKETKAEDIIEDIITDVDTK